MLIETLLVFYAFRTDEDLILIQSEFHTHSHILSLNATLRTIVLQDNSWSS